MTDKDQDQKTEGQDTQGIKGGQSSDDQDINPSEKEESDDMGAYAD